ncbi:MAG TPA: type I-E CRISPR-associated protein Cse2/CasB [Candidatus Hydrogenedentes bacterium]|nr:type I-E CRISPR-associated protein Cse2/CasB [Candidatus Hydrogenedentota bacterium]HOL75722.1 type I-E CRISPR-associated protein Cse2/CasB [Candidatus Hydrogenedentota bacterium]HPO84285.1 type I-E CRISPR-associated protein Cse2/CasB [Candidatus Hydrogenedentota bacterium]
MTPTESFIRRLESLGTEELFLLRASAGKRPDESIAAFDCFTSIWWPLRAKSPAAPRREVAWLITKLYASYSIPNIRDKFFPQQLGRVLFETGFNDRDRFCRELDNLLLSPLAKIEHPLRWAMSHICKAVSGLDWVALTDELSIWEKEEVRDRWRIQILRGVNRYKGVGPC